MCVNPQQVPKAYNKSTLLLVVEAEALKVPIQAVSVPLWKDIRNAVAVYTCSSRTFQDMRAACSVDMQCWSQQGTQPRLDITCMSRCWPAICVCCLQGSVGKHHGTRPCSQYPHTGTATMCCDTAAHCCAPHRLLQTLQVPLVLRGEDIIRCLPCGMNTAPRRASTIWSTSPWTKPPFFSPDSMCFSASLCMSYNVHILCEAQLMHDPAELTTLMIVWCLL